MFLTCTLRQSCFAALKYKIKYCENRCILTLNILNQRTYGDKSDKKNEEKKKEAKKKLNLLLNTIIKEKITPVSKQSIEFTKPKRKEKHKDELKPEKSIEEQTVEAAKTIAATQGKDSKKIESELLSKLLFKSGIKEVSSTSTNVNQLVSGMKIDHEQSVPKHMSRAHQVRQILDKSNMKHKKQEYKDQSISSKLQAVPVRTGVFTSTESLGIFGSGLKSGLELKTWKKLAAHELKLAVTHPPTNYYQELELWTEQGKLWKFPIDNEQGMDNEKNVSFTEHIFLDRHLEPWCPKKGPVRHFMELVCVGLSKNHYLSVDEKQAHINWYKEYFESKKDILLEVGAIVEETK